MGSRCLPSGRWTCAPPGSGLEFQGLAPVKSLAVGQPNDILEAMCQRRASSHRQFVEILVGEKANQKPCSLVSIRPLGPFHLPRSSRLNILILISRQRSAHIGLARLVNLNLCSFLLHSTAIDFAVPLCTSTVLQLMCGWDIGQWWTRRCRGFLLVHVSWRSTGFQRFGQG